MSCEEIDAFIDAYLAGELAPGELEAFRAHIAVCENCVRYIATYQAAIALGRRALASEAEIPEALIQAILRARES